MLEDFVVQCRQLAAEGAGPVQFAEVMRELVADPSALATEVGALHVPNPIPQEGIDHIVFEDETLTVVTVDVNPGVEQPPHEHLMPAIIGVFEGAEVHRFYSRGADGISRSGGRTVGVGDVLSLGSESVHAIASADQTWCRGIHVYLGSLSSAKRMMFHPETFVPVRMEMARYADWCRPMSVG
jgi:predicted metal-dependent enzyme (double-stranded beta helix superfamily)